MNDRNWEKRRTHAESLERDKLEMLSEILDKLERLEKTIQDIKEKLEA